MHVCACGSSFVLNFTEGPYSAQRWISSRNTTRQVWLWWASERIRNTNNTQNILNTLHFHLFIGPFLNASFHLQQLDYLTSINILTGGVTKGHCSCPHLKVFFIYCIENCRLSIMKFAKIHEFNQLEKKWLNSFLHILINQNFVKICKNPWILFL